MTAWWRVPALHFLAGGALLFAGVQWWSPRSEALVREPIVIDEARVAELREDFVRQTGLQPGTDDELALIEQALEEEILYREALALGLDRFDRSVRYRLSQKMRFLEDRSGGGDPRDDEELYRRALELGLDRDDLVIRRLLVEKMRLLIRAGAKPANAQELQTFFAEHREDYREPERISFAHVFLSPQARGAALSEAAERLLAQLRAGPVEPGAALERGDAFPLGGRVRSHTKREVASRFGPGFAEAVFDLNGPGWSGPLRSPYGLHLVWIESRTASRLHELDEVRSRVELRLRAERADARLAEALRELRRAYPVRVDHPAWIRESAT